MQSNSERGSRLKVTGQPPRFSGVRLKATLLFQYSPADEQRLSVGSLMHMPFGFLTKFCR